MSWVNSEPISVQCQPSACRSRFTKCAREPVYGQMCTDLGTLVGMSPRDKEPQPTTFAVRVADALSHIIEGRGISKRELARRIDMSNNYVAIRFRHEAAFTLTDIDVICTMLGLDAGSFLAGVTAPNVTPIGVRRPRKDDLKAVASESDDTEADDRSDEGFD